MTLRLVCGILVGLCCWAVDPAEVARHLAERAEMARRSGQVVRAYLLYAEAAKLQSENASYRENRDSLAPIAALLRQNGVGTAEADIEEDVKAAQKAAENPNQTPQESFDASEWRNSGLQALPHVEPRPVTHNFDLRGDERTLFEQVASVYGVRALWDPALSKQTGIRFQIDDADFRTALEALTAVTHTFVFPVSPQIIFFANDTEQKREELEPTILLTVPLPDSLGEKDLIEASNAVRSVLNLRSFGWDSANRVVFIRDRFTRAHVARSLLAALLLPKSQVALEVQFLAVDSEIQHHYGLSFPGSYELFNFGHLAHFQETLPSLSNPVNVLAFGGGATLLGVAITDSTLFAIYSKSFTRNVYDATIQVTDGQTANLHFGRQYPIPTSIYTGAQQSSSSSAIYNPVGQFNLEDLGLVMKVTPHIHGDGEVAMDIDVQYKALGTQTFNTVPSVAERQFTGNVILRQGQWAVLAGLDQNSLTNSTNGIAGLNDVPVLRQLFGEHTSDKTSSETLVVIKPTVTRLPVSATLSPQFLLGPMRGQRVLL